MKNEVSGKIQRCRVSLLLGADDTEEGAKLSLRAVDHTPKRGNKEERDAETPGSLQETP